MPLGEGRLAAWTLYFNWWQALPARYRWFGIGPHTAEYLPQIQLLDALTHGQSIRQEYFLSAHNDFLQALVEYGYVGFSLFALVGGYLMWRAPVKKRAEGAALLAAMATNFPWHAMPHMFVYWLWIKEELCRFVQKRRKENLQSC